jgi:ribosomal protein S14
MKITKLPKNSAANRVRNRCWKTGRPRGYFRYFGLCRNVVREYGHDCLYPSNESKLVIILDNYQPLINLNSQD